MNYQKTEIKEGITLHMIPTNKFKTNLLAVFLTTHLNRETITKNALLSAVLRRGSMTMPTQEEISIQLEEMYGGSFDCGIEKIGDNQVLKFYLENVNDDFLPNREENLKNGMEKLWEIVWNPLIKQGGFCPEYIATEKENLRRRIEGRIDNKAKYALDRCIEEMYQDKPYGLYRFGYVEDLQSITPESLYTYYQQLMKECKIDLFVSGKIEIEKTKKIVSENENIQKLVARKPTYYKEQQEPVKQVENISTITESMDVVQGKLVIGMDVLDITPESKYITLVYNTILGGGATSKLFQNVREKASLAYTAGSNYIKQKNNIFIRCGIEIQNFDSAVQIIKQQVKDMEQGNFSEEELQHAKTALIATISFIPDEQDTEITYYFGQELTNKVVSFEEYIEKIQAVTKEQIIQIAQKIKFNTIFFLKD